MTEVTKKVMTPQSRCGFSGGLLIYLAIYLPFLARFSTYLLVLEYLGITH